MKKIRFNENDPKCIFARNNGDIILSFDGLEYEVGNRSSGIAIYIMHKLKIKDFFILDIGCGDGVSTSNTYDLIKISNESRCLLIDSLPYLIQDARNLYAGQDRVKIVEKRLTTSNILQILKENDCPSEDFYLSIDIDGLDYVFLDTILGSFKPRLICMEINEKIPPPIKFYVKDMPCDFVWDGSHFYGCSIQSACDLCAGYGYEPVCLEWNNLILIRNDSANLLKYDKKTVQQLYDEGYSLREYREDIFSHNKDVDIWRTSPTEQSVQEINRHFKQYVGLYEIQT